MFGILWRTHDENEYFLTLVISFLHRLQEWHHMWRIWLQYWGLSIARFLILKLTKWKVPRNSYFILHPLELLMRIYCRFEQFFVARHNVKRKQFEIYFLLSFILFELQIRFFVGVQYIWFNSTLILIFAKMGAIQKIIPKNLNGCNALILVTRDARA